MRDRSLRVKATLRDKSSSCSNEHWSSFGGGAAQLLRFAVHPPGSWHLWLVGSRGYRCFLPPKHFDMGTGI